MMHHVWLFTQLWLSCWADTLLLMYAGSSTIRLKQGHLVCWTQGTGEGNVHCPLQRGGSSWQLGIKLLGGYRNGTEHTSKLEGRHKSSYPRKPPELAQEQPDCWGSPASHCRVGMQMVTEGPTLAPFGSSSACAWVPSQWICELGN